MFELIALSPVFSFDHSAQLPEPSAQKCEGEGSNAYTKVRTHFERCTQDIPLVSGRFSPPVRGINHPNRGTGSAEASLLQLRAHILLSPLHTIARGDWFIRVSTITRSLFSRQISISLEKNIREQAHLEAHHLFQFEPSAPISIIESDSVEPSAKLPFTRTLISWW
jgi:hypothetical protein